MKIKRFFRVQLELLFQEYEQIKPNMYFEAQKLEDDFVITDISDELLNSIHLKYKHLRGESMNTVFCIKNDNAIQKYQQIYQLAWTGERVLFYFITQNNSNLAFLTYIEPEYHVNQIKKIKGRCVPFEKNTVQHILQHAYQFVIL
ncbi:hypothetical protein [Bacillus sp. SRB3LM]|uniref:hypothetical protein n=1 Tax=Bacillus sp. SRB3LM TaxID=2608689 RepID=UPI0018C36B9D|nr:hypothetical protein [Bacillus sp. SRB3LM]MBG0972359.1 hypothetical protein [Bacillus sp. SRB3LM]